MDRLWRVDGLRIDLVSAVPSNLAVRFVKPLGRYLYLITSRNIPGTLPDRPNIRFEMWRWDGRSAHIEPAPGVPSYDRAPGRCVDDYDFLEAYDGRLYYEAPDFKLYSYDGTTQRELFAGNVSWKGGFGGRAFFTTGESQRICGDEVNDEKALIATNGTTPAVKLADLGAATFQLDGSTFVPFKNALYFRSARTATGAASQLWRFTGSRFERVSNRNVAVDSTATQPLPFEGPALGLYKGQLFAALAHRNAFDEELFRYSGSGPVYQTIPAATAASLHSTLLAAEEATLDAGFEIGATPTSADDEAARTAAGALSLVSEQPVRGVARLRLTLPAATTGRVAVYDALGREVERLHDGALAAGTTDLTWTGDGAGVYVVRATVGGAALHATLVRVR